MSVGETDYTQRVIAIIRPSSMLGGRLIYQENFETIVLHTFTADAAISTTATRGTVWQGERSGLMTMGVNAEKEYEIRFPLPMLGFLSMEVIFQPTVATEPVQYVAFECEITDGEYLTTPKVRLRDTGSSLIMEVYTSADAYETVATIGNTGFPAAWHLFQITLNTLTRTYVKAQFDNRSVSLSRIAYYEEPSSSPPSALTKLKAKPKTGYSAKLYFDDILISYEEI